MCVCMCVCVSVCVLLCLPAALPCQARICRGLYNCKVLHSPTHCISWNGLRRVDGRDSVEQNIHRIYTQREYKLLQFSGRIILIIYPCNMKHGVLGPNHKTMHYSGVFYQDTSVQMRSVRGLDLLRFPDPLFKQPQDSRILSLERNPCQQSYCYCMQTHYCKKQHCIICTIAVGLL